MEVAGIDSVERLYLVLHFGVNQSLVLVDVFSPAPTISGPPIDSQMVDESDDDEESIDVAEDDDQGFPIAKGDLGGNLLVGLCLGNQSVVSHSFDLNENEDVDENSNQWSEGPQMHVPGALKDAEKIGKQFGVVLHFIDQDRGHRHQSRELVLRGVSVHIVHKPGARRFAEIPAFRRHWEVDSVEVVLEKDLHGGSVRPVEFERALHQLIRVLVQLLWIRVQQLLHVVVGIQLAGPFQIVRLRKTQHQDVGAEGCLHFGRKFRLPLHEFLDLSGRVHFLEV